MLDILESVERNVRDFMFDAIFFQPKTSTSEEDIAFSCGGEIRHTVTDKDDERRLIVVDFGGLRSCFLDGGGFIVSESSVILPDDFPFTSVFGDVGIVGDDINVSSMVSDKFIEHSAKDRFETSGDDVEGDLSLDTELVEFLKIRIHLQSRLHHFKSVFEGDI